MNKISLPSILNPEDLTCIIDTREKTPANISKMKTIRGSLVTGDYTISGFEKCITIERKSLGDLIMCVGRERDRFSKELKRMLSYPCRAVVVESTWEEIDVGRWQGKITPEMVSNSILSWMTDGIPFVLAGNNSGDVISKLLYFSARKRYLELYNHVKDLK